MPACECCWTEASQRGFDTYDYYHDIMKEHEDSKCECTQDTREGAKLRAGQFWIDGKDTRLNDH